jgi:hypothetical protein
MRTTLTPDADREVRRLYALERTAGQMAEFLRQWVELHPDGQLAEETRRLLARVPWCPVCRIVGHTAQACPAAPENR